MKKPVKTKIVYRDRPIKPEELGGMFSSITLGSVRRWLFIVVPIVASVWGLMGPYFNAQAEQMLRNKLIEVGIDPENIQLLNKNLTELQKNVDNAQNIGAQNAATLQVLKSQNETILQILMQKSAAEPVK